MADRENGWDALRALLMLLGIPFHAALPYSYGANTVVLSSDPSLWAELLGNVLSSFRMAAFFIVAGYFAAHAIERKGARDWWSGRLRTLAIPLVVGLICFIPIQMFIRTLVTVDGGENVWSSFVMRLTTPARYGTGHLWFLIVLLEFCLITALAWSRIRTRLVEWGHRLTEFPAVLIAAFMVPLVLLPRVILVSLGLDRQGPVALISLGRFAEYAPFFALGLMLLLAPSFLASFAKLRWGTVLGAALASSAFVACDIIGLPVPGLAAKVFAGTLIGAVLIGLARQFFVTANPIIRWFVDASFTIYLFHFPIVCISAYLLEGVEIGPEARMATVIAAALIGSCLAHMVVSRSSVLLLLFNGRPLRRRPEAALQMERKVR